MNRTGFALAVVFACLVVRGLFAQDTVVEKRRAETIAKADRVFGPRYTPSPMTHLRLYDEETEDGPPDAIMYWHGSSYVIELVFASDGTIARLLLLPEALLYTRYWGDVPDFVELSLAEMQWLIASSDGLQSLGKVREVWEAPDGCFQSGPNLYCADSYELASVSHYHSEEEREKGLRHVALRDIEILYKQSVGGIVEDARTFGNQRQIKVGGQWYHGDKPGEATFNEAQRGSLVRLVTYGCTANRKACTGVPEPATSTVP